MGSVSDWNKEVIDYAAEMRNYNVTDKGPIFISEPFPLLEPGKPQSGFIGETIIDPITIRNTTDEYVQIWNIYIYDSNPKDSFTLSLMEPPSENSSEEYRLEFLESSSLEDRILGPGRTLTIWLLCKPKGIGLHGSVVHFSIDDEEIERLAFLFAEEKISISLASKKPFHRRNRKKQLVPDLFLSETFVSGPRPPEELIGQLMYKLPFYRIPDKIRKMLENKHLPDVIQEGLTKRNYVSYFKILVIMEEIKLEEDMRGYDMERVYLRSKDSQFLTLEVPGLAERRPSLVCGDFILVKFASEEANDNAYVYQGYIHHMEAEEVYLMFDREFHMCHNPSNLYNVQFTYNRTNMRRLYQAIEETAGLESQLLFPSESFKRNINPSPFVPISCMINKQQMRSIEMILGCKGGPPYVIHGPPGTGKTMTLLEAILQIYTTRRRARILICAPSNSAADHILQKLLGETSVELQHEEIFWLDALTRPIYINVEGGDLIFKCPKIRDLMPYRIVISTYASASLLYPAGIERGHFSHIFLDEAGQASEPETMVPLSNLCGKDTVVVLAGDPMQLGPVIFSRDTETRGLGKSYLERLFECKFYEMSDENYVTKLVQNYRCHPEIMHLPSELFYGGLISCKENFKSSLAWTELLPNKEFPVLFIGIQGCDEREGSNPSWFNHTEASKVVEYITLIQNNGLTQGDIGVITPYRQQVLKIKNALENIGLTDLKVGSVEQFQGQEREVIIISTVRSTVKHNEFDRNHCLGFLSNPRRFNVAITRARSLLIIIGNPHIICQDRFWNKLLWHCYDNGSYQGCCLPERQDVDEGEDYPNYEEVAKYC